MATAWPYEHGHGLRLVRAVADQLSIVSDLNGTRATVAFTLPGPLAGLGAAPDDRASAVSAPAAVTGSRQAGAC